MHASAPTTDDRLLACAACTRQRCRRRESKAVSAREEEEERAEKREPDLSREGPTHPHKSAEPGTLDASLDEEPMTRERLEAALDLALEMGRIEVARRLRERIRVLQ